MSEVVYYVAASLDAYIATPDGSVMWLSAFESGSEGYGYPEFYQSVDSVLMGSRTYEQSLTFGEWPYPGKPCCVSSKRALAKAQPTVMLTHSSPAEVVSQLRYLKSAGASE